MSENALAVINSQNVGQFFIDNGLDPIIEKIRQEVKAFVPDISTDKGRKEIASMARKVASSKVALDDLGKDLVSGLKHQTSVVDAERKRMRDMLDALRDETRKPLTDWEEKEESRVEGHKEAIVKIEVLSAFPVLTTVEMIQERINTLSEYKDREWEEFHLLGNSAFEKASVELVSKLAAQTKADADRLELERLKKEDQDRQQREREGRIKQEAADKAKKEAEDTIRAAEDRAKKAEEDKRLSEERAAKEKIDAEKKAALDSQEAVRKEKERADKEKADQEAATRKREADIEHKKKINNEALMALKSIVSEDIGKAVIEAIAKGQVPHIKISY